ncbi:MAG: hypothetical protein U5K27_00440 [Desulfotignum sp.]|nr:hypothetical protein [Desulfotignum sp.]
MSEKMEKQPKGAGKSSFELIDLKKISDVLPVKSGSVVLDLACGRGDYTYLLTYRYLYYLVKKLEFLSILKIYDS